MTTLPTHPEHLSYSQYNAFSKCARSWYLGKVRNAEERQSWYTPIGSVVHSAIEAHLKGEPFDLEREFYSLISAQMEVEPDLKLWLAGGPELAPITHDKALQRAVECIERADDILGDLDVWEVEYDASGRLPGLEVEVKAYVDIIGEHKTKGPVILDWKTGSTKPSNFQLETYAALLKVHPRFKVSNGFHGKYAMISPTYQGDTRYVDLSGVDPAEVGAKYQAVLEQMKARIYKANVGHGCKYCFMQPNCLASSGPTARAKYYDRSEEDGIPY